MISSDVNSKNNAMLLQIHKLENGAASYSLGGPDEKTDSDPTTGSGQKSKSKTISEGEANKMLTPFGLHVQNGQVHSVDSNAPVETGAASTPAPRQTANRTFLTPSATMAGNRRSAI